MQRCYGCKEELPPRQSIGENEDAFLPNIYNGDRSPYDLWIHGQAKAMWSCPQGHSWRGSPRELLSGRQCPICYGRNQPKAGMSLLEQQPTLALEWCQHNARRADGIPFASGVRGCWNCSSCGHHWNTTVKARSSGSRTGCPSCNRLSFTSRGENQLYESVKGLYPDAVQGARGVIPHRELDVYIPSISIAMEYNGEYWHSERMIGKRHGVSAREYHWEKMELCRQRIITLLYIWESQWLSDRNGIWERILSVLDGADIPGELQHLTAPLPDIPL